MKTKQVGYSYPTSLNAKKHGIAGGYSVTINDPLPEAVIMFKTEDEAYAYADKLPFPYSYYDKRTWKKADPSI